MRLSLDKVNWSFYNKSLVRRGEATLDFDVIDSWYSELHSMKNGERVHSTTIQIPLSN